MATVKVEDLVTKLCLFGKSSISQALANTLFEEAKATRPQVTLKDFDSCFTGVDLETIDQLDLTCVYQVPLSALEVQVKAKRGGETVSGDIWYSCTNLATYLTSLLALCTHNTPLKRSDLLDCFSTELLQHLAPKGIRLTSDDTLLALDEPVHIGVAYES